MDFSAVVTGRRMVRRYRPDPVDSDALERIAAAATSGPSAGYAQGVVVITITDEERRAQIARLAGEDDYVARGFEPWLSVAPVHIVLCVEPQRYRVRYSEPDKDAAALDIPWWWVDAGAALSLALLAAVDEGLAAGFLGAHAIPGLRGLLEIPVAVEPVGLITLGHPLPDRPSSSLDRGRRPADETVRRDRW
ncbi:nitroreductase family protein [bacterium]|nr:nitroreductase family protein [bacterium]